MSINPRTLRVTLRALLSAGLIWGLYFLRDNIWFRAYPVVISSFMWGAFLFSLKKGRTPLVEVSARAMRKTLNDAEVRYCYHLTVAWVIFMSIHLGITLFTLISSHAFLGVVQWLHRLYLNWCNVSCRVTDWQMEASWIRSSRFTRLEALEHPK